MQDVQEGGGLAAAVGHQLHGGGKHRFHGLAVAAGGSLHEVPQQLPVGFTGHVKAGPLLLHALLRAVHQLAAARFRLAQHGGNLGVVVLEHLAHQEGGPFFRRQPSSTKCFRWAQERGRCP